MNCLPPLPLSASLSLSFTLTDCLSGSFFFIEFLPFAFYCQNINAADTKSNTRCTLFINGLPICGMRGEPEMWHGMVCAMLWHGRSLSALFVVVVVCLALPCQLCLLCLSHNSNAKFQLKSQSQSMRKLFAKLKLNRIVL